MKMLEKISRDWLLLKCFPFIGYLQQQLEEVKEEKDLLEIMLETITEHATDLENRIFQHNRQMLSYLQQVEKVTTAADEVEKETFEVESLNEVAARSDELGQLARVFQKMIRQVKTREQKLKQQLQELKIEVDKAKQSQQVAEVVESVSFQSLKEKQKRLKQLRKARQLS